MYKTVFINLFFSLLISSVYGQFVISGKVLNNSKEPVPFAHVYISTEKTGTVADEQGNFKLKVSKPGNYRINITSLGYEKFEITVKSPSEVLECILQKNTIQLSEATISGERYTFKQADVAIKSDVITDKTLQKTQSANMAEGLSFITGVRVENNCQSCGFTQVRLNGLDGKYSQILIDGRPIFGQLAGVYALEHFPASGIEQIEILHGGGSSLNGKNAIGGTLNIITKSPQFNGIESSFKTRLIQNKNSDMYGNISISRVHKSGNSGFRFSYSGRYRNALDLNKDSISDLPRLQNHAFFIDAYAKKQKKYTLAAKLFYLIENRRGGNYLNLVPHQTDITEALKHHSAGLNLSLDIIHTEKHITRLYVAGVFTHRNSYYGSGGRSAFIALNQSGAFSNGLQNATDSLYWAIYNQALNAYGNSFEIPLNAGAQLESNWNKKWKSTLGVELQSQFLNDKIPGYNRKIKQHTYSAAFLGQIAYSPLPFLSLSAGLRVDYTLIKAQFRLTGTDRNLENSALIPVPRVNILIKPIEDMQIRVGYGRGFRLPQFADEDLHISLAGGNVVFISPDKDLKPEFSDAVNLNIEHLFRLKKGAIKPEIGVFYNHISGIFVLSGQQESEPNVSIINKRNGQGASVYGITAKLSAIYTSYIEFSVGLTVQKARYQKEEIIWQNDETGKIEAPEKTETRTQNILRTPEMYGHTTLTITPINKLEMNLSAIHTGSMRLPKITGSALFPETESQALSEYTEIRTTRSFFDLQAGISYSVRVRSFSIRFDGGVSNVFNSFQKDLDFGIGRDAAYIYGPMRPRSFYFGITLLR